MNPQRAQEALQAPFKGWQLQKVLIGPHEFIQEPDVPLLHLKDPYLLVERVGTQPWSGSHR